MAGIEDLLTGHTLLDRYRIGEVIGRGGFAAVYRAVDERLQRTVAVKVITLSASDPASRDEIQRRFQREAHAVARIQHPNVVSVYDFGVDPTLGMDFLVMELLEGEDLAERLARPEPIPIATALHILRDVALGVNEGHRVGLIHRDIKPRNAFLSREEEPDRFRVCVLDFGIARFIGGDEATQLTRSGAMPLSPAYASPEQLRGEQDIAPASDVFSLGVVGYQLLTRKRLFPTDQPRDPETTFTEPVAIQRLNADIPDAVARVIQRALAESPQERYTDAGEFAQALEAAKAEGLALSAAAAAPMLPPAVSEDTGRDRARARSGAPARPPSGAAEPRSTRRGRPAAPGARWAALLLPLILVAGAWWAMARGGPDEPLADRTSTAVPGAQEPFVDGGTGSPRFEDPPPSAAAPPEGEREPSTTTAATPSAPQSPPPAEARGAQGAVTAPVASRPAASPPASAGAASATRLNQEGERLFAARDFPAAADRFRRAVQTDPTSAHFRNNLGWALFQLNELDEAARHLEEAARQDPRRAIVHANIGEVRWAQGNKPAAIAAYERFLELNTNTRQQRIAEQRLRELRAMEPPAGV